MGVGWFVSTALSVQRSNVFMQNKSTPRKTNVLSSKRRGRPYGSKIVNGKLILREDLQKTGVARQVVRGISGNELAVMQRTSHDIGRLGLSMASEQTGKLETGKESGMSLVRKFED